MRVDHAKGSRHDFALFKDSVGYKIHEAAVVFADSGYQGIKKYHPNSFVPIKKPRNGKLSNEDRRYNRALSRARIMIEHINAKLKRFKIISSRCRSRHSFARRFDLICTFHNFELANG